MKVREFTEIADKPRYVPLYIEQWNDDKARFDSARYEELEDANEDFGDFEIDNISICDRYIKVEIERMV